MTKIQVIGLQMTKLIKVIVRMIPLYIRNLYQNAVIKHTIPNYTVEIDINSIDKIDYKDYQGNSRESAGVFFIFAGMLTSFIIAPLISINFKNGKFNQNRYYTAAGIGLGMLTIGIPLTVSGRNKTFFLKQPPCNEGARLWRFK